MNKVTIKVILSIAVSLMFVSILCYASSDEFSFTITPYQNPMSVRQSVKSAYRETSTGSKPVYYKYSRSAEPLSGDKFENCYTYMCHGTGTSITELNDNMLMFNFNLPEAVSGNSVVYFSVWYRSKTEFVGRDSQNYAGQNQKPYIMFNSNNVKALELETGSDDLSEFIADGVWHKKNYLVPVSESVFKDELSSTVNSLQFRVSFLELGKAADIEFAGMKCGVLKLSAETELTDKKALTYLSKALTEGEIKSLSVNGEPVSVRKGKREYAVSVLDPEVNILAENAVGGLTANVEKIGEGHYRITAYGPWYDSKLDENDEICCLMSVDDSGNFDETRELKPYILKKSDVFSNIDVYVKIESLTAKFYVNGTEKGVPCTVEKGDRIAINERITNVNAQNLEFVSVIVLMKDGYIYNIYPFRTKCESTETAKDADFEVIADEDGLTADYYVIDVLTFADCIK